MNPSGLLHSSASIAHRSIRTRPQPVALAIQARRVNRPKIHPGAVRLYSDAVEPVEPVEPPDYLSEGERKVFDMIKAGLKPTRLEVQDVSGGCGSMYALDIVSEHFKGLPVIKQHRLVNKVLGDEMKSWHGVQLQTKAPS